METIYQRVAGLDIYSAVVPYGMRLSEPLIREP